MNPDLLDLLACPACGGSLELLAESTVNGQIDSGRLKCTSCEIRAPIVGGIPRFVPGEAYAESFGFQWSRFRTTQLDIAPDEESERTFVGKTAIDLGSMDGQTVLDVGCGMGRFAEVCARHGARVIGVDLSDAVEPAAENLRSYPRCDVVQADVFDLPFADGVFDVVYSIGVLHHTPDTKEAFLRLPKLLKPNGEIAIWVYSGERVDRLASGLKYTYRRVTPRIGRPTLLAISRIAAPLYRIHTAPYIGFFSRKVLPTAMHPDPQWRVLDTFDDYSPKYRWRHTYDEVLTWFAQAGLVDLEALAPRVAVRGRVRDSAAAT